MRTLVIYLPKKSYHKHDWNTIFLFVFDLWIDYIRIYFFLFITVHIWFISLLPIVLFLLISYIFTILTNFATVDSSRKYYDRGSRWYINCTRNGTVIFRFRFKLLNHVQKGKNVIFLIRVEEFGGKFEE